MEIIADDKEILDLPWAITMITTTGYIIRVCAGALVLKDGDVYYLKKVTRF